MEQDTVKVGYIYKITCLTNGKGYVGWTKNTPTRRFNTHVYQATHNKTKYLLHKAIRKYGRDQFIIEVLYSSTNLIVLKNLESHYIKEQNTFYQTGCGYNMTEGGDGTLGYRFSEDAKRRIGLAHKGKPKSPEQREKMSRARLGWKPSDETRAKMSVAKKKKRSPHTLERRIKIGLALKKYYAQKSKNY